MPGPDQMTQATPIFRRATCLGVATLLLVSSAASNVNAQLPLNGSRQEGLNAQRTNQSAVLGPQTNPAVALLLNLPEPAGSLRRITDSGILIVGQQLDGIVSAYTAAGTPLWQASIDVSGFSTASKSYMDIAIGPEGNIYVTTPHSVTALDEQTGAPLWPTPYVGNDGNENSALAVDLSGTVFFHSGNSFLGGFGERLAALSPNGTVKWEISLPAGRGYSPIVMSADESTIYLEQFRRDFGGSYVVTVGISAATGQVGPDSTCRTDGLSPHLFDPIANVLYAGEFQNPGNMIALDPVLDSCARFPEGGTRAPAIALSSRGVIVQHAFPQLLGLSRNGLLRWAADGDYGDTLDRFSKVNVVDAGGVLYAARSHSTEGASVTAIDTETGEELWTRRVSDHRVSGLFLGPDGNVYLTAGTDLTRISGRPRTCEQPIITSQPQGQSIASGQSASLAVIATGENLTYQWYRGFSGDPTSTSIAGATSSSFVTPILSASETFWVRVSNECGAIDSNTVAISVGTGTTRPHIALNPTSVSFSAVSGEATPAGRSIVLSNTGGATLNFTATSQFDWCHLSPVTGSVSAGASRSLTVSVDAPSNIGTFSCAISVADGSADNSPQVINISYLVEAVQVDYEMPPLGGKTPPLKGKETRLWQSFSIELGTLVENEGGNFEQCTLNTIRAARKESASRYGEVALRELASRIFQASVPFNAGSVLGNILLRAGTYFVGETAFGNANPEPLLLTKAVLESTIGYVLGSAISKVLGDPTANQLTDKVIDRLIKDSGALYTEGVAVDIDTSTSVKMIVSHTPETQFVVGILGSSCSDDRYIFRYRVTDRGVRTSDLTFLLIHADGQRELFVTK